MQQPIETTSALADLGAAPLSSAISRIQNNVFTYQRSKAAKFLHLVPILHFTAYTLPRVAPTTPPTSYTHHINFSSFEKSKLSFCLKHSNLALHGILAQSKIKYPIPSGGCAPRPLL